MHDAAEQMAVIRKLPELLLQRPRVAPLPPLSLHAPVQSRVFPLGRLSMSRFAPSLAARPKFMRTICPLSHCSRSMHAAAPGEALLPTLR